MPDDQGIGERGMILDLPTLYNLKNLGVSVVLDNEGMFRSKGKALEYASDQMNW